MITLGGSCEWYQVGCHVNDLLHEAERSLLRPIGEKLQDWERDNRETIQRIGNLAEDITREVAPDVIRAYAGIPPKPQPKPAPPAAAGELPGWVVPAGIGAVVLLWWWLR